ncbi:nSTAND1 domain-containing NTPase [Actinomadura fibrosa]|uniref:Helix-turn-helix domain-containing protein n=1 Tax=Actinomadura fibrosa TaxID=111802 RepID=A0ABW2XHS3_9ACTN|nr:helix-turn-helix domain-containing protein [Actinomadura fibrosa]
MGEKRPVGRPSNPIDYRNGAVAEFAERLRQLRERKGLTVAQLAQQAHIATGSVSKAASGRVLPSWEVAQAYLAACGEDPRAWRAQWEAAGGLIQGDNHSAAKKSAKPPDRMVEPRDLGAPQVDSISSAHEFHLALLELRVRSGNPSLRVLCSRAREAGHALARSTLADALRRTDRLPPLEMVEALLAAYKVAIPDRETWRWAWSRVAYLRQRDTAVPAGRWLGVCPYPGLAAFDADHAEVFYGREELIQRLSDRLPTAALLAVIGASGTGKSSLVHAGLLPALSADKPPGSATWPHVTMRPGSTPLTALAGSLAALTGANTIAVREALAEDPASAQHHVLEGLHSAGVAVPTGDDFSGVRRLVVVVDQFEELFTLTGDETERRTFITALTAMAGTNDAAGPAVVIVSVRSDFFAECANYPALTAALENSFVVGPMTDSKLRLAITGPAAAAGLDLEADLVETIMDDLPTGPGVLPFLAHTLRQTWEHREGNVLTRRAYVKAGTVTGGIQATAEAAYAALTPAQQTTARELLLRMVSLTSDGPARRRVHLADLEGLAAARIVLDVFTHRRLIVVDGDTAEIAHDALLVAWPRLTAWISDDRDRLRALGRVTDDAQAWQREDRDPALLYAGPRLNTVIADLDETVGLPPAVPVFLHASRRLHRRAQRRRLALIAILALLVLMAALAVNFALREGESAQRQRKLAESRQLAAQATQLRSRDVNLAAQLALAAYRISPTTEARSALLQAAAQPGVTRIPGSGGPLQTVAFTRNGREMATGGAQGTIRLWNTANRGHPTALGQPLHGHHGTVNSVAFSPDGRLLVSGGGDGVVRLWSTAGSSDHVLPGTHGAVYAVAFSPDGRTVAAASADQTVRLWSLNESNQSVAASTSLTGFTGPVQSVAFSPDGRTLAAGGADGTVRLWDLADRAHPRSLSAPLTGAAKSVLSVAFSPDGRTLAAGGADGTVRLWDLADRAHPRSLGAPLTGAQGSVTSVAFTPDGHGLAAAGMDAQVRIWNLTTHRSITSLPQPAPATAVVFLSNRSLATSGADGMARIWDLADPPAGKDGREILSATFSSRDHILATMSGDGTARLLSLADPRQPPALKGVIRNTAGAGKSSGASALSPDGRFLAAGGSKGAVQLWDVSAPDHPKRLNRLTASTALIEGITFSPNGSLMAVASSDKTVSLWDVTDPRRPIRAALLTGPADYVYQPAFSPDGRTLAAGSADRYYYLWDVTDPSRPTALSRQLAGDSYVFSVVFSPDGRTLATAGTDSKVRLWDVSDRRLPALLGTPLTGPSGYIYSVAFGLGGRQLAASGGDGSTWLWGLTQRHKPRAYAFLTGPVGPQFTNTFDARRPLLVTAGRDATLRIWTTDPEQAAAKICATAGQPITRFEWDDHLNDRPYDPPCK